MTFGKSSLMVVCSGLLLFGVLVGAFAQPAPQSATAQPATPPASGAAYSLPPEKLAKAIAVNRIRNILDIVYSLWGVAAVWLLLATRAATRLADLTERIFRRRWLQGLLFFAAMLTILNLANLPLGAYGHWVSLSYGISVQGWGGWLADQGKALAVGVVILSPVLLLFNWIVRRWPGRYWLGIWLVSIPLMVFGTFVSPLFEPIFDKFEPLQKNHAALVSELEKVVERTGTAISPDRMFLMMAAQKTNGLNAYVNGIGATKRIVVWDTTAGRIPDDEILFIFGHESGHYVLNHIPKQLAGGAIGLFFMFAACAWLGGWLAKRFGARWGVETLGSRAGFVVLILTVTIASCVLEPAGNTFSRYFEHEADVYGQEAIHGIVADPQKTAVAGFSALGEAWLEDPNPNSLIEFWEYNHPSVKNRADFAARYDPWANGGHGQFFDR